MKTRNLKDLVHFDDDGVHRELLFETDNLWSEMLCLDAKQTIGPMGDGDSDALFTVLAGEGRFNVGRRSRTLRQWGSLLVPADGEVTIFNTTEEPLVLLLVASPPPLPDAAEEGGELGEADDG